MFNGSNCDRKSQLSGILTEPLNPRDLQSNYNSFGHFLCFLLVLKKEDNVFFSRF